MQDQPSTNLVHRSSILFGPFWCSGCVAINPRSVVSYLSYLLELFYRHKKRLITNFAILSPPSSSVYAASTKKTAPDFDFMYCSHSATSDGIFFEYLYRM